MFIIELFFFGVLCIFDLFDWVAIFLTHFLNRFFYHEDDSWIFDCHLFWLIRLAYIRE